MQLSVKSHNVLLVVSEFHCYNVCQIICVYLLNIDSGLPLVKFLEHGSWNKSLSTIVPMHA